MPGAGGAVGLKRAVGEAGPATLALDGHSYPGGAEPAGTVQSDITALGLPAAAVVIVAVAALAAEAGALHRRGITEILRAN